MDAALELDGLAPVRALAALAREITPRLQFVTFEPISIRARGAAPPFQSRSSNVRCEKFQRKIVMNAFFLRLENCGLSNGSTACLSRIRTVDDLSRGRMGTLDSQGR